MRTLLLSCLFTGLACAHVGSPDVFFEGDAGPYRLLVTVRPPPVIPGVAEIEVRGASPDIREVHIVPLPLRGPGARFAPTPDLAQRSKDDAQFYTGSLWMMASGSWQVRVTVDGVKGKGELAVPVTDMPGAWIISNQTITPSGKVFVLPDVAACNTGTQQQCNGFLASQHLRRQITYQPASRFWAFQAYETAILAVLSLALAGFCVWWIRSRRLAR